MKYKNQKTLVILSIATLILLNGCATNTPEKIPDFCTIYYPIYTTPEDTEITKKQVDQNNISFDCLCKNDDSACDKGARNPP